MEIVISQKTINQIKKIFEIEKKEQLVVKVNELIEDFIETIMRFFQ